MKKRKVYLKRYEVEEARRVIFDALREVNFFTDFPSEVIDTRESVWRTTKKPVFAKKSVPEINISAMDGIATKSKLTISATDRNPVYLKEGEYIYINTGNPVPYEFDCVIKIEDVWETEKGLEVRKPVKPFENIRLIGEDVMEGDLILEGRRLITPEAVSLLISADVREIEVLERLKVTIIPTGDEIVPPFEDKSETQIHESNSFIYSGYLSRIGARVRVLKPVPDNEEEIQKALLEAVRDSHAVIISAGTSAGEYDYTARILEKTGKLLVHGVDLRPGKPFIFGLVEGKPVFGLPGYPGAAINDFKLLVLPVFEKLYDLRNDRGEIKVTVARKIPSSVGEDHLISLSIGKVGEKYFAIPLKSGSGILSSFLKRNGYLKIEKGVEGVNEGEEVVAVREVSPEEIDKTIFFTGSHDLLIDFIKIFLREYDIPVSISSIGSLGGMVALKKGVAHIAGTHLIDEETGEYNLPYIKKLCIDNVVLIHLAKREQGIMVPKGNPKRIESVRDLRREDVMFINRQRGSGTRMFVDLLLRKEDIRPEEVKGYTREVITHTEVALQVKNGNADCGIGIYAAARIFNLDFVPLGYEEYDLLVKKDFVEDERFKIFLEIIQSKEFKEKALQFGGYDLTETGKVKYEG